MTELSSESLIVQRSLLYSATNLFVLVRDSHFPPTLRCMLVARYIIFCFYARQCEPPSSHGVSWMHNFYLKFVWKYKFLTKSLNVICMVWTVLKFTGNTQSLMEGWTGFMGPSYFYLISVTPHQVYRDDLLYLINLYILCFPYWFYL